MVVTIAKLASASCVGEFALGVAVTLPIFTLSNLNLRSVQATDSLRENRFVDYLGLRLTSTPIAILLVLSITFLAGYSSRTTGVILAIACGKAVESVIDVIYGELQSQERLDWIACSMMLKSIFSLLAMAIVLFLTESLILGIAATCFVASITLLLYDIPRVLGTLNHQTDSSPGCLSNGKWQAWRLLIPVIDVRTLRNVFAVAFPLGFVAMLGSLNVQIPRYFIEKQAGQTELGIYHSISAIFSGLYFFQIAIGHAILPRLARYFSNRNKRMYLKYAGVVMAIGIVNGFAAVALAVIGGKSFLQLVFTEELCHGGDLFFWLAIVSVAQCISGALAYFLQAARHFQQTAIATTISTIVVLLGSATLVPRFGAIGGAYAVLVGTSASGLVLFAQFLLLFRHFKENRSAI